jgi:hypothetical protein
MSSGFAQSPRAYVGLLIMNLALLAFVLSGCGGGGDSNTTSAGRAQSSSSTNSSTSTSTDAPAASFASEADGICKRLNATLAKQKLPALTLAAIARLSPGRALLEEGAVHELERLQTPTADKAAWDRYLAASHELAAELAQLGRVAKQGDEHGVEELITSKKAHHSQAKAAASKLGLTDCTTIG